ncbi:adenylate/guanylate cyclase domain-containing protein [Luteimicrobium sp. DT211]|uniref:adenylate/guanylate cyclase domain-containing protein n=1 Tax=Luteimicrobium sp. DT211 TaxID=3393412 RepID=UPI003CF08E0C
MSSEEDREAGAVDDQAVDDQGLDDHLLGGPAARTAPEVAADLGTGVEFVHESWRALGLSAVDDDERIFTDEDVRALQEILQLADDQHLDQGTVTTLLRSTGHTMDRLVLWQAEALVGDLVEQQGLDPVAARLELLERLPVIAPVLERQLTHAWRRQLAAYAGRYAVEFSHAREQGVSGHAELRLARAVGFADIVDFTKRTAGFESIELAHFVQDFESGARDVISAAGARVVKTIGDAVLYVADNVATGAEVALGLAEAPTTRGEHGVPVRVSLVWGRVLARFGDVFGPSVNLAARLVDIADPGSVLVDRGTAGLLADDARFALTARPGVEVQGLGAIEPVQLQRAYRG